MSKELCYTGSIRRRLRLHVTKDGGSMMAKNHKVSQSEIDGVSYRRVPTWQIAVGQLQGGSAMAFYVLLGMASYLGDVGYGIVTAVVGVILSATRILDGVIDPFLAVWIDKFHSRFGKLRIMLLLGVAIRSLACLMLFVWFSGKTDSILLFVLLYSLNIVGNSIFDIAGNMIPSVMTNDPRQRPTVQVWATVYNYMFPIALNLVATGVLLPKFGGEYNVPFLAAMCWMTVIFSLVMVLIACIGLTPVDKPENFAGTTGDAGDNVSIRDMLKFLKGNKPFRLYIYSAVSDKLAQNVNSQAIVTTMLFGILIGNVLFGTILTVISMLPSILFAIFGAKYAGKHGSKKATVTWTWVCMAVAVITTIFCACTDMTRINILGESGSILIAAVFLILLLAGNGAKMCVTTANGSMRADIVDYELDRSGKYLPAVVTATYNFIDQPVTSLGATIATLSVALIGYTDSLPQPTDAPTAAIKVLTLCLYFGLPILGWICTLIAMKGYHLDREEMIQVQKRIAEKKAALSAEES